VDLAAINDPATRPWRRSGASQSPADLVAYYGLHDRATFVTNDSLTFLASTGDTFDLVWLDGNHDAPHVYREIAAAARRLNPGGVILLHDYFVQGNPMGATQHFIPGPYLAARRACQEHPGMAVIPLTPLPWPAIGASDTSTLAVLGRR
jgi:hypothetical protein